MKLTPVETILWHIGYAIGMLFALLWLIGWLVKRIVRGRPVRVVVRDAKEAELAREAGFEPVFRPGGRPV